MLQREISMPGDFHFLSLFICVAKKQNTPDPAMKFVKDLVKKREILKLLEEKILQKTQMVAGVNTADELKRHIRAMSKSHILTEIMFNGLI